MAEELDPILETSLRAVLRAETERIPFTLRADTLRRVRDERQRARRVARLTWLAAAAVVVIGVVGLAALSALRAPNQIASPSQPALPSFDRLRATGLGGPEIARYEGTAGSTDAQWQQGVTSMRTSIEVVIACTGPGPVTVSTTGREVWPIGTATCTGQALSLRDRADPNLAYADSPTIMVQASGGTAFRYVVLGEPGSTPDASTSVATPDADGLATYDALRHELQVGLDSTSTLTGEQLTKGIGDQPVTSDLGAIGALQGQIAASCVGQGLTVGFGDGRQFAASKDVACGPGTELTSLPADIGTGAPGHLMVRAMPSVTWRVVAGVAMTPVTTVGPSATLPSDAALLAAAGQGAVPLASAFGDAGPQGEVVTFSPMGHRGAQAVVIACHGDGTAGIAFADSPLPQSDPGGSESPFAYNPATCDGAPHVVPWDGWNAAPDFMATGPNVGLSVPSGIGYRAILVDTSAVASDGETTPVTDGLPTFDHLSAIHSDRQGGIVTTHEALSPSSGASSSIQAADIRADDAIKVLIGCAGGTADLTLGNATGNSAAALGSPVCDGTVQEFDADTVASGPHAASLLVSASAGTTWRLVVRDMTASTHPKPSVPCGGKSGLKQAPLPTLFAGGKAIGTLPGYYTSAWGTTHDDGVPLIPPASIDVKANTPLQLRVAGDVCAEGWTILYGTPRGGGLGIDPVGALALLGTGFVTTQASRENRIDLQTLPAGDWVLEITLDFANGSGTGLLRVRVSG